MLTYCVKCTKITENINPKMVRTKNNKIPCLQNKKVKICERTRSKGFIE